MSDPYAGLGIEVPENDPYEGIGVPVEEPVEAPTELTDIDPYAGIGVPEAELTEAPERGVGENLPEKLEILGMKTDIDFPKEAAAVAVGWGHGMSDIYRGAKQMLDIDVEHEKKNEELMNRLYADDEYGSYATAGEVAGMLTDPVGVLVPISKAKTLAKAVGIGAGTGAAYGGAGYVDEENNQTRLGNAMMGTALGGTIAGTVHGVVKGTKKVGKALDTRSGNKFMDEYELKWAEKIAEGKTPREAREALVEEFPGIGKSLKEAFDNTKRIPHTQLNQAEATQVLALQKSTAKPRDIILGRATRAKEGVKQGADTVVGVLSTRIKKKSKKVFGRLRKYEYKIRARSHEMLTKTEDFSSQYKGLSDLQKKQVDAGLINGKYNDVSRIFKSVHGQDGVDTIKSVQKIMSDLGDELTVYDRIDSKLKDYFPRFVQDKDGMLAALDKDSFVSVKKMLDDAEVAKGNPLTPVEESDVINKFMRKPSFTGKGAPTFTKARKFDEVPAEFMKFYSNPTDSLHSYINNSIQDIEKAKFFGKGFTKSKHYSGMMDIDESVGNFLRKEIKSGELSSTDVLELSSLLTTRFGLGERAPIKILQDTKNIIYTSLLGNPVSAVTQLGDVGVAAWANGLKPAIRSAAKAMTGNSEVTVKEFGLVDKLAEELSTTTGTAKFLNKALRWSGFEAVDRLGKSTLLNSSLQKHIDMFKLDPNSKAFKKQYTKFADKYQESFEGEFASLVNDLKKGRTTDNVKLMLFNELSDFQPISLSEMPEQYLKNPNGRVVYMFKTFMLKQIDVMRREAYDEMRKGNVAEGAKKLATYGAIVGTSNTGAQYVKDMMMGKEVDPDAMDIIENTVKTFGWSEYMANQIAEGKPVEAGLGFAFSPVGIFDQLLSGDLDNAMRLMPVFGKLYYQWMLGGVEKDIEKAFDKEYEDLADEEVYDDFE